MGSLLCLLGHTLPGPEWGRVLAKQVREGPSAGHSPRRQGPPALLADEVPPSVFGTRTSSLSYLAKGFRPLFISWKFVENPALMTLPITNTPTILFTTVVLDGTGDRCFCSIHGHEWRGPPHGLGNSSAVFPYLPILPWDFLVFLFSPLGYILYLACG